MAKIYDAPSQWTAPSIEVFMEQGRDEYERQEKEYIERVREFCKKRKPKGQLVGEIIRFGVADGYAQYMVAGLRPLELIHLDLGDGYHFQYANRLTAADVRQQVEAERKLAELFGQ